MLLYNKVTVVVVSCDHQKSKLSAVADDFWVASAAIQNTSSKSCFADKVKKCFFRNDFTLL